MFHKAKFKNFQCSFYPMDSFSDSNAIRLEMNNRKLKNIKVFGNKVTVFQITRAKVEEKY